MKVSTHISDLITGAQFVSNTFHFTFCEEKIPIRCVEPSTYVEAMQWIDGKRRRDKLMHLASDSTLSPLATQQQQDRRVLIRHQLEQSQQDNIMLRALGDTATIPSASFAPVYQRQASQVPLENHLPEREH